MKAYSLCISIGYAVNPELTNMTSATFKDIATGNTTVMNGNGITITPAVGATPANPVSLTKDGLNNGNNQIKGGAPGTEPTQVMAGVTHKFDYSPEKNIPDRYKAGPISSVYVMQDEVSSLKKENAEQKYVIADQVARLTTLEAENEQQRCELAETKKGLDNLKAAVDKLLASKG